MNGHDLTDPTHSTSPALNRKAFVGLSAGIAAAGSTGAAAFGADADFGKPHPPIVPEDDPAIAVSLPTLSHDGRSIDAYAAVPEQPQRDSPGVVVIQAIWGVDTQLRDVVRRFAKAGYATIAPNLFTGLGAPSGDGVSDISLFRDAAGKLADDTVDKDIRAAAQWLRLRPGAAAGRIGAIGFCMGGANALRQAADEADVISAVAVFYGKVRYGTTGNNGPITPIALAYADEVRVPIVGSWGARDTSILADDVRALDKRLTVPHDFKVYDEAGHAFFDDTREAYVGTAAGDAWKRTLSWFDKYLRNS